MKVQKVIRKSPVLKNPAFGCLKDIPTVNVTRGCLHRCVYCYARSFPETPKAEVHLYENLPEKLRQELASRRRRGTLPWVVAFSTASDAFQPHPEVLEITFQAMKALLEAGVTVSFLSKGRVPERFWALFAANAPLVQARFGLVSLDLGYHRLFEPRTAPPYLRLRQLEKSAALGLSPAARIDPIIPGITDREEAIESLMRHLVNVGVKEVSVSYLVLRPAVVKQMQQELPSSIFQKILASYRGQPWVKVITSATTKLARLEIREQGYNLFKEIGRSYGLEVRICGCKNPDLPFEFCAPWEIRKRVPQPKQLELFRRVS